MGRRSRNKDSQELREHKASLSEDESARVEAEIEARRQEEEARLTKDAIAQREDEWAKRFSRIDQEADDDGIFRRREALMAVVEAEHVIWDTGLKFSGVAAQRYVDAHSVLNAVIIAIAKRDTSALENMAHVANEYQRRFQGDGPAPDIVLLDGRNGHEAEEALERALDRPPFDWDGPIHDMDVYERRREGCAEFLTVAEHSRKLLRDEAEGLVRHLSQQLFDQLFVPGSRCLHPHKTCRPMLKRSWGYGVMINSEIGTKCEPDPTPFDYEFECFLGTTACSGEADGVIIECRSERFPRDSTRWLEESFVQRLSERQTYGGHMDGGFINAVRCRPGLRKEVEAKAGESLLLLQGYARGEEADIRVEKAFEKSLRRAIGEYQEVLDSPGGSEPADKVLDDVEATARAVVQAGLRAIPDRTIPTDVAKNMYNASRVKKSRERARKKAREEKAGKKALEEKAGKPRRHK